MLNEFVVCYNVKNIENTNNERSNRIFFIRIQKHKNKIGNPVVAHKKIAEAIHLVPHRSPMLYTM